MVAAASRELNGFFAFLSPCWQRMSAKASGKKTTRKKTSTGQKASGVAKSSRRDDADRKNGDEATNTTPRGPPDSNINGVHWNDPRMRDAFNQTPNEFSPEVLELLLTQKCVGEGCTAATAYGIYSSYPWGLDSAGDKYRGPWRFDPDAKEWVGNPAESMIGSTPWPCHSSTWRRLCGGQRVSFRRRVWRGRPETWRNRSCVRGT